MLTRIFAIIALVLLSAAYLSYEHLRPWVTFNSEMLTCLAALIALGLLSLHKAQLPLRLLPLFAMACIPLLQYYSGIIFFMGGAFLHFAYLFLFAAMVWVGYSAASTTPARQQLMQAFCIMLLFTGLVSSFIAVVQWLQLEQHFFWMMGLSNSRPYANFAQPNNYATFSIMALLATVYLTEKRHLHWFLALLFSVVLLLSIALTQSRTAWLSLPFIVAYWAYKQRLHVQYVYGRYMLAGLGLFVAWVALLPSLNLWLNQKLGVAAVQTASAVARASGGHERLTMWQQMLAAIELKPFTGYGWGQVAYAQSQVLEHIPLRIWFNSSHNLFIDLLVVNGVILGLLMVLFLLWWLWQLHRAAQSTEAVVALLMVAAILIHAMLEYPQRYAYFLLPMGLLLGLAQAQQASQLTLRCLTLPKWLPATLAVLGLGLWGLVWRDYSLGIDNIKAARQLDNERLAMSTPQYDQQAFFINPNPIILLDQFERTAYWVSVNPFNKVDAQQIERYGYIVALSPSRKNLVKYAQLLAYNGQPRAAQRQLQHLQILYGVTVPYPELLLRNR